MGIVRLNMAKTLESTAGNTIYLDVPKDGEVRGRFLPPFEEMDGNIWFLTENHFRLKTAEGRGTAIACLKRHGHKGERCFLCDAAKYLEASDDPQERAIGKGREAIAANRSWYAQIIPIIGDNKAGFKGTEVKLLRLPKTGADAVNDIFKSQQKNEDCTSCDPDAAQDISVFRKDTGQPITKYGAMTVGKPRTLDDILPNWEELIMTPEQVWKKLDIKLQTVTEQIETLRASYPLLDVDGIVKACGY